MEWGTTTVSTHRGMARIRRAHDSKKIDDHIIGKSRFIEQEAQDAPVKDIDWDVQKAEVHSDPVIDSGVGPKVIIRRFRFNLPPGLKEIPSHDELLEYHKKNTVIPMLWKDELDLIQEPRIVAGKKGAFTIVAICAPRVILGVRSHIHEQPELVHNLINKHGNNSRSNPN